MLVLLIKKRYTTPWKTTTTVCAYFIWSFCVYVVNSVASIHAITPFRNKQYTGLVTFCDHQITFEQHNFAKLYHNVAWGSRISLGKISNYGLFFEFG